MEEKTEIELTERETVMYAAVKHIVNLICTDERRAYFFADCSESRRLLIKAASAATGRDETELENAINERQSKLAIHDFGEIIKLGEARMAAQEEVDEQREETEVRGSAEDAMSVYDFIEAVRGYRIDLTPVSRVMVSINPATKPVGIIKVETAMFKESRILKLSTY